MTNPALLAAGDFASRTKTLDLPGLAIHVRDRGTGGRALCRYGRLVQAVAPTASLFVNDRADVARITHARGLHLPESGLPLGAAREVVGPDRWIGRSVHTADAARAATDEGVDYVFLGPIWETPSHPNAAPLGLQAIEAAQPARVVAIGGIDRERVEACRDAGAYGVALIRGLWTAPDPGSAASAILLSFTA